MSLTSIFGNNILDSVKQLEDTPAQPPLWGGVDRYCLWSLDKIMRSFSAARYGNAMSTFGRFAQIADTHRAANEPFTGEFRQEMHKQLQENVAEALENVPLPISVRNMLDKLIRVLFEMGVCNVVQIFFAGSFSAVFSKVKLFSGCQRAQPE